jgi:hypothetical protein
MNEFIWLLVNVQMNTAGFAFGFQELLMSHQYDESNLSLFRVPHLAICDLLICDLLTNNSKQNNIK